MKEDNKVKTIPIIKYNPIYRNDQGAYKKEEWTSYSDIGEVYDGKVISREEYLKIEELYIKAVFLILSHFNANSIEIDHIFKISKIKDFKIKNDLDLYKLYRTIQKGDIVEDTESISKILKLRLREYIGELELLVDLKSKSEIIFGFDYYMYLKTNQDVTPLLTQINDIGLFTSGLFWEESVVKKEE